MHQDADMSGEVVCANLSHLLSRATSSPLEMREEQPDMLRTLGAQLPPPLRGPAERMADAWAEALNDRQALSLAYARLFLGPFEILAPPYASFYLEPDQRIMGQVSNHVASAYADAGLKPGEGPREAPDHVALEWEFIHYLTHRYATTGETIWLDRRNAFLRSHMAKWIPSLASAMTRASVHPFYNTLAGCLATAVDAFGSE